MRFQCSTATDASARHRLSLYSVCRKGVKYIAQQSNKAHEDSSLHYMFKTRMAVIFLIWSLRNNVHLYLYCESIETLIVFICIQIPFLRFVHVLALRRL